MTQSGDFPPHELRGNLGNVMDPGGGGNTLKPSPLPNAIVGGGPGLATAAGTIPGGPTVSNATDPQALALLVAQLAGEWFGGASIVPAPSASSALSGAGASLPTSPGVSPAALGVPMSTSMGAPMSPSMGAPTSPSMGAPMSPSMGVPRSPSMGAPTSPSMAAPMSIAPSVEPSLSQDGAPSSAHHGAPSSAHHGAPTAAHHGAPSSAAHHGAPSSAAHHGAPTSSHHGAPSSAAHHGAPSSPQLPRNGATASHAPAASSAASHHPPVSGHGTDSAGKSGFSTASVPASARSGGASRSGGATTEHGTATNPFDVPLDLSALDGGMPFGDLRLPVLGDANLGDLGAPFGVASRAASGAAAFDALESFGLDTPPRFDAPAPPTNPMSSAFPSTFGVSNVGGVDAVPGASALAGGGGEAGGVDLSSLARGFEVGSGEAPIRELGGVAFDPYRVRRDFPILEERVRGKRLVWLDNAATTQKPRAVIERLSEFYRHENSNIHRAAHTLAARATDAYERGRESARRFLNASSTNEIVFVRGATEGINLVAQTWGKKHVQAGDEIVLTHLEHHANIVPWQMLCAEKGARLRVAPVDDRGDIILEEYERLLNPRTKLVALPQVSNALGTITPAREMVEMAHRYGARVLVDGAQAVSHMKVDVQVLDCDFYVFSGHKVFAPTGIGVVYGKRALLDAMPPYQGGGNMIQDVTFERTTYHPAPFRFEAGTGNIADAAGLGAALEYVMRIGMDTIDRYEHDLLVYATERLSHVPGLRMIGTAPNKAGVLSFVLDGQRTEDVGAALDQDAIAVRSGHHCAQPILRRFGLEATVRASLAFYNVCEDVDALVDALLRMQAGHARRG